MPGLQRHVEELEVLLGRDFPEEVPVPEQFDFLEACLASSAFPIAFQARPLSNLFPGRGRTDALLCDGGIFDNLPFFPAIRVLSEVQSSYGEGLTGAEARHYLATRHQKPALLIAAGLDPNPEAGPAPEHLFDIHRLSNKLGNNLKMKSFEETAGRVDKMTQQLLDASAADPEKVDAEFVNQIISTNVLAVLPEDAGHLNGTFAFCRATGLDHKKMGRSIGHGCFQTLAALAARPGKLRKSLDACLQEKRLVQLEPLEGKPQPDHCPHFQAAQKQIICPFTYDATPEVRAIHGLCATDRTNQRLLAALRLELAQRTGTAASS